MTLNEIFLKKEITTQAYNTCVDNNIDTLMDLKQFYSTYGSFEHLTNCDPKSNIELVGLCVKYFDFVSDSRVKVGEYSNLDYYYLIRGFNQIQIDALNKSISIVLNKLSIRSINAISRFFSGAIDAEGFSKCLFQNNNFEKHSLKKMNNVGLKSLPEILAFFNEIKNSVILISNNADTSDLSIFDINSKFIGFEFKVSQLNNENRLIVNNFILSLTSKLSVRSYNAICNFLENRFDITVMTDKILMHDDFNFSVLKNVGRRSIPELEDYINKIKEFTINVLLEPHIFSENIQENNIADQTSLFNMSINIYELVDRLINEFKLLNQTETFIFKHTHNLYIDNKFLTLDEISEIILKTPERIRQIREKLLNKFRNGITSLKQNDKSVLSRYNLDLNEKFIIITDDICRNINLLDQTNFSKEFMTFILSVSLESEFTLIGGLEAIQLKRVRRSNFLHEWKSIYLVKNELFKIFDFNKFIDDVELRISEKIIEDYKFNFKSYLSNFSFEMSKSISVELVSFCEQLLNEEFSIFLNINEDIIFERNTFKTVHEYAREALEDIGVPAHKDLIEKRIKELYPNFDKTISSTSLKREYGFVPFGRSSVFGLKKWELENKTIKGGTIRDIVEEFLMDKSDPIHIKEISDYVLQYRPESNLKSIIHNIKMEDNNRFLFFKNSLIGLKKIKYNFDKYQLIVDSDKIVIKSWDENLQILKNFVHIHNRLPSSMGCPLEEIKINRWLNVQRTKINRNLLEDSKKLEIQKIINNHVVKNNKTDLYRNVKYSELEEFIKSENRLPSSQKSDESRLYHFFYNQRELFHNSKLESNDLNFFFRILKLIKNK